MTTSKQDINKFAAKWTNYISEELALNLIKQIGGVDSFIANFEDVIDQLDKPNHFSKTGKVFKPIQGFSNKDDMLAFFDANRADLIKFVRLSGAENLPNRGIVSGIDFIRLGTIRYNLNHDEISDVLHHTPSNNESSSNERIIIGQWLAKTALLQLCIDYNLFLAIDDFFNSDPNPQPTAEEEAE